MYIDDISRTVTAKAATRLADLETALGKSGFTTGLFPQPAKKNLTVGQMILQGLPNLFWMRYGLLHEACIALEWRWRRATITTKNVPRAATGPDLKGLFIGSRGRCGRPLTATFRLWSLDDQALVSGTFVDAPSVHKFGIELWAEDLRPVYFGVTAQSGGSFQFTVVYHAARELLSALVRRTKELAAFYGGDVNQTERLELHDDFVLPKTIMDPLSLLERTSSQARTGTNIPIKIERRLLEAVR